MAYWNQSTADFSNLRPAQTPDQMGDLPEPEGFFESIPDALTAGAVNVGNAFWAGTFGTTAVAVDWVTSKLTGQLSTTEQDVVFGQIVDPGTRYANTLSQQERTFAGSLAFGVGKVLTEFAAGGAGVMATAEFYSRATSEVLAGKSAFDANMLALNQAAFAYAGAAIPGALGGTLGIKVASGAGINVLTGIAQRSAEKGIYWAQGDERFANYTILDPTEIIVDAVLGAAFGPLDSVRTKGMDMPDGKAIDGAMLMDRARFEDVQVGVRAPDVMAKVDRGIAEQVRAMQEGRPALVERLPDEVTMPSRDGLFAKVGSEAYRENLRAWMGDSKVVDENGSPLVVYHGTRADFNAFDTANRVDKYGRETTGSYFTANKEYANEYAGHEGSAIVPSYLSIKNPLVIDDPSGSRYGEMTTITPQRRLELESQGYDGIIYHDNIAGRYSEIVAFNSAQIKSAIGNSGRFDLESGNLTDLVDVTGLDAKLKNMPADEIAAALGIKPDPDMKAMQAEVDNFWRSQADLSQPVFEDIDPSTVAEIRAQAQAIEDAGGAVDDAEYQAASDKVEQVKSIRDIMGCMLRLGV